MDKKKYLSLVLPVVLHQLVTTAVSFIDVLMISELGAVNVAAVGICQNLYFIYYLFTTGMAGGMGIFISQYWGQKDIENIRRMLRMALVVVNSALIVLVLGGYFAAETVIHMTAGDAAPEVVQLGVDYFHLAMLSYLFSGVSLCFAYALRSIDKPGPVLLIALLSLGLKVLLNYGLIFGNWGCPAMGIRGAAVALVITRMVEMVMTMLWVYKKEKILAIKFRHLFDFSWPMLKKLMKISLPVMINDVMYAVGMLFYVGAYSRIAVQALAAVEVANTIQNFFTTVVIGLGAATAVVVGNMIGEGRADQVLLVGRRYLWIAIGAGVGVGALMVATIPLTVVIFPIEAAVLAMVRKLLWVYGLCLPLRAISIMMTMGLLRGGGDTTFAFLVESSTIWLVGVPAVLISALVFKWPIQYVVAFTYLEQVAKGIACLIRFTRGKWIHNLVEQPLQP